MTFENKLIAIVNKEIPVGVAMNAIAHMVLGLGAHVGENNLRLDTYEDKDGNLYPNISQMPFIVLRGKSTEIKKAIRKAKEQNVLFGAFTNTMTGGGYEQQLENTKNTA